MLPSRLSPWPVILPHSSENWGHGETLGRLSILATPQGLIEREKGLGNRERIVCKLALYGKKNSFLCGTARHGFVIIVICNRLHHFKYCNGNQEIYNKEW